MRLPRLKSFRDRNQVVVGIVGIVAIGALVAGALGVGTLGLLEDRYEVSAVFERVAGLDSSADVRVAGVSVGAVRSVEPDFDAGQVVVHMEIDRGVDLGPETTAEIAAATLLGGYYVRLDGPVNRPHLEDLPEDDARRRIPLERTSEPVSLNQALEDTTATVDAIDFDAANRVLEQLAGGAARNVDVLPRVIDQFTQISTAISARDAELRRLTTGADQVLGTLAERDQELARLIESSDRLLAQLVTRRDALATVLGEGSAAVAEMTALLAQHRASIDGVLRDLSTVGTELGDALPALNRSLAYARVAFPLVRGTLDPKGGFSVRGEGILVNPDQVENILDVVDDLLVVLGV